MMSVGDVVDARARRAVPSAPPTTYVGLVTRTIAFAVDAAVVNGIGILVGVVVGLGLSILDTPDKVDRVFVAVGGVLFVAWTVGYFVTFWSATGQTPGNRLMRIRVRRSGVDEPLRMRWALARFGGVILAAVPLLLGFVPILLNDRRRGLQDLLGRSVVVHAPRETESTRFHPGGMRQTGREAPTLGAQSH
jgi:uncharacterized RDD family membrane protein YckC